MPMTAASSAGSGGMATLAGQIIRADTSHNAWTVRHRFDLYYDLLERVEANPEGLALIVVWLRFSAIRQLTWQRNYNTKPRELAHSQERLTGRLADFYRIDTNGRPLKIGR